MNTITTAFNPFDYMDTQEEINAFLRDCLADEDPNVFVSALGHLVKKHGVTDIAELTGLSRESLYKTFNGKTQPKWSTIFKVTHAIGLHLKVA
ncbi:addiction module antidote protein [Shewanella sp. YLB-07]|uniref:addiction module antidote protein n=1 Tax=Shewanella sp. YLB-07 TaxID=2601268 RepID=UPI00128D4ECA|nr:addiction module antidote protein [Shewanella sp. YLB-07]MPY24415.1 putative addiction module antidote protein [Shewanella sp. YLB-07]